MLAEMGSCSREEYARLYLAGIALDAVGVLSYMRSFY